MNLQGVKLYPTYRQISCANSTSMQFIGEVVLSVELGVEKRNVSDVSNDYMNQTRNYSDIYYLGDFGLDVWQEKEEL